MKVVLVTAEYSENAGGLAHSAHRFRQFLEAHFCASVDVIITLWENVDRRYTSSGGYSLQVSKALENEYRLKVEAGRIVSADMVVAFGAGFNAYFASLLAERLECALFVCFRGSDGNLMKWRQEELFFTREACKSATRIACVSEELCDCVMSATGLGREKIRVIPNAVDSGCHILSCDCFTRLVKGGAPVVFGTGAAHLNEKKGVLGLIRCLAALKTTAVCEVKFIFAGVVDEDLMAQYLEESQRLGVHDSVEFVGRLSHDQFSAEWMAGIDCYVQGSVCEGFGNAVAEAMSCGKPVVLTNTGYFAEKFKHTFPEILFEGFDPDGMARRLLALSDVREISERYNAAYSAIAESASEQAVSEEWTEFLTVNSRADVSKKCALLDQINAVIFHDIQEDVRDGVTVLPDQFEEFLSRVSESGFFCCSMRRYLASSTDDRRRAIVLTFDDGYRGVADYALPALKRREWSATVFVNSGLIGCDNEWNCKDRIRRWHMNEDRLAELVDAGWEIGSHGVTHRSMVKLSEEELLHEVCDSLNALRVKFGAVDCFAYPYGDYTPYVRALVAKTYSCAFAVSCGGNHLVADRYSIRRYTPQEMLTILEDAK